MNEIAPVVGRKREWSAMQTAIFGWFEQADGFAQSRHLIVRARAGTGKTTTICEGVNRARERSIWVAAFNADIAKDLAAKITNPRAKARTFHSVGLLCIKKKWAETPTDLDKDRGYRIAEEVLEDPSIYRAIPVPERLSGRVREIRTIETNLLMVPQPDRKVIGLVAHLATRVKEVDPFVVNLLPTDENPEAPQAKIDEAIDRVELVGAEFDLLPEEAYELNGWTARRIAAYALAAVVKVQRFEDYRYDFADMIFLPLVNGWTFPTFAMTVVDEAQDVSAPMLEFAKRMTLQGGRLVFVGDDKQAIYGFRGADSGALDRIKKELDADELPLSITYRCPTTVVREANRIVQDFYAAPGAPAGVVRAIRYADLTRHEQGGLAAGDLLLSRVNSALMGVCLELLRERRPVSVLGREFGEALQKLARKICPENVSLEEFQDELNDYVMEQTEKLLASTERSAQKRLERLLDQCEALRAIADGMAALRGPKDAVALTNQIRALFAEGQKQLVTTCSTVHKVKGLEWDRVFILTDTMYVFGMRKHDPEEANIEYVAITRAKKELVFVTDMPRRKE